MCKSQGEVGHRCRELRALHITRMRRGYCMDQAPSCLGYWLSLVVSLWPNTSPRSLFSKHDGPTLKLRKLEFLETSILLCILHQRLDSMGPWPWSLVNILFWGTWRLQHCLQRVCDTDGFIPVRIYSFINLLNVVYSQTIAYRVKRTPHLAMTWFSWLWIQLLPKAPMARYNNLFFSVL